MAKQLQGKMSTTESTILTKKYRVAWKTNRLETDPYYKMVSTDPYYDWTDDPTIYSVGPFWEGFESDELQDVLDYMDNLGLWFDPNM